MADSQYSRPSLTGQYVLTLYGCAEQADWRNSLGWLALCVYGRAGGFAGLAGFMRLQWNCWMR